MRRLILLMAVCAGFTVAACDSDSPFQPRSSASPLFSRVNASGIAASAVSPSEIDLTWEGGSTQAIGFQVFRSITGATGSYSFIATTAATATSYADVGLTESTTYCYKVRSFRTTGRNTNYSAYSEVACATTKLGPPTGTEATPVSSSSIRVRWSDNSANEDGFRVEQASSVDGPWTPGGTAAANGTSLVRSVASEQLLCFRVLAFNPAGNSLPSTPDCTAAPAAPTNLVAVPRSDGIEITWQDNSSWEFGYVLQGSTDGVTFSTKVVLPANTTGFHESGVGGSETHWYRVVATRDGGVSDPSNAASSVGGCSVTSDTELCDNGLDDNCDGLVDLADPACGETVNCSFNPCGSGSICNGSICVSSCGDGYKDSDEADIDCGGGCNNKCQVDQQCWGNWDCSSDNCVYAPGAFQGVCQPPRSQP